MLWVKLLRLDSGLSQWELSRAAAMSQGRYSMLERGHIPPTPEELEKLATALGASAEKLFTPVIARTTRRLNDQNRVLVGT